MKSLSKVKGLGVILALFFSQICLSQVQYEKGYFISNDDKRTDCLIKNNDWSNNPTEFQYKLVGDAKPLTGSIQGVKEFGVANSKYVRSKVKIDKSTEDANKLSTTRDIAWVDQEIFLEVLVEGQVNLFAYRERNLERYFYGAGDAPIEQFVYRLYRGQGYDLGTDKRYIGQLRAVTGCDAIPSSAAEKIKYHSRNDWIHYFHAYDECKGVKSVYYNTKDKIGIHLRLTPGIDLASINVQTPSTTRSFDKSKDVRIGAEVEFVLPVNKGKWSFLVEPTYRHYHEINKKYVNFEIDYRSIEVPVGLRHGFFLGEHSKIFVDAAVVFDIDLKSTILMTGYYKIRTAPNVAVGIGYSYKKLGIEFRYYTPRNLTVSSDWRTDFQKTCLVLSYRIF